MEPHIFLVDDDPELRRLTADYLSRNAMRVTELASADELFKRLARVRPDLVVLDVMMPGTDGLAACRQLRAQGDDIPIIMLTARSDEIDRILGLEMGSDDYLGKPFNPRELLARIQVVLRRKQPMPAAPQPGGGTVRIGSWRFDLSTRTVDRDNERVTLTDAEYALLRVLVENPHRPLSRERLLEMTREKPGAVFDRSIDVAIFRLRKLIEPSPQNPRYLQTIRGHGYVFVPDETS
jgi:two-component system phosphate regulon response regulator OmpR